MVAGEVIKEIFMKAFESSYEMECSYLTPHLLLVKIYLF
jgi:hypothetical protein